MRFTASNIHEAHPDYATLIMLRDEIARMAGGLDELQRKFPALVRDALDFVLDPVRTARTRVSELDNVEKTFIGLKLEHFVRDMLDAPKGHRDLIINGMDVDIKNTVQSNWSIPQETYRASEPCLLMAVNDAQFTCSLGLVVARPDYLHAGAGNRDTKKGISAAGFEHILWIVAGQPFPQSRFFGLDMERFRDIRKAANGNQRVCLFARENLRRVVHRDVMQALLFDQYDYMKRLRANGGAPDTLRHENIAILMGTYMKDRSLAAKLGIPDLGRAEIVALAPRSAEEFDVMRVEGGVAGGAWTS